MNSIQTNLAKAMEERAAAVPREPHEDEYRGEDGFLYCKKCHTPRETISPFFGKPVRRTCTCACRMEAAERQIAEQEAQNLRDKIARWRNVALPDPQFHKYTFDNDLGYNPGAMETARNYVEHFETFKQTSQGLLFWGGVGTGKTFLAGCIVNALLDRGYYPIQTNFPRLLTKLSDLQKEDKNDFIDKLNTHDLLVIDDLGVERNTDYTMEMCFHIIDSRYRTGLPMIITTNLPLRELMSPADQKHERIYDRILERCTPVCVNDQNVRRVLRESQKQQVMELLRPTAQ